MVKTDVPDSTKNGKSDHFNTNYHIPFKLVISVLLFSLCRLGIIMYDAGHQ